MKVLYKTITGNTQVYVGKCFLVGAELTRTAGAAATMIIYDEASTDTTDKIVSLCVTPEKQADRIMFDKESEPECVGLYVVHAAGIGTVYYHL